MPDSWEKQLVHNYYYCIFFFEVYNSNEVRPEVTLDVRVFFLVNIVFHTLTSANQSYQESTQKSQKAQQQFDDAGTYTQFYITGTLGLWLRFPALGWREYYTQVLRSLLNPVRFSAYTNAHAVNRSWCKVLIWALASYCTSDSFLLTTNRNLVWFPDLLLDFLLACANGTATETALQWLKKTSTQQQYDTQELVKCINYKTPHKSHLRIMLRPTKGLLSKPKKSPISYIYICICIYAARTCDMKCCFIRYDEIQVEAMLLKL